MPRIYVEAFTNSLTAEQAQHVRVLRLKAGDQLELFDGAGHIAQANITSISKKIIAVDIAAAHRILPPQQPAIHLAMSLIRNEMMDLTIQKAVELGVTEITPIIAERTQGRLNETLTAKRMQHWHKVMISACEQSGYNFLPKLNPPSLLADFIATSQGLRFILEPEAKQSFKGINHPDPGTMITLLVGPEGGLTETEVSQTIQAGFTPVMLHGNLLRAETAAISAVALAQFQFAE